VALLDFLPSFSTGVLVLASLFFALTSIPASTVSLEGTTAGEKTFQKPLPVAAFGSALVSVPASAGLSGSTSTSSLSLSSSFLTSLSYCKCTRSTVVLRVCFLSSVRLCSSLSAVLWAPDMLLSASEEFDLPVAFLVRSGVKVHSYSNFWFSMSSFCFTRVSRFSCNFTLSE